MKSPAGRQSKSPEIVWASAIAEVAARTIKAFILSFVLLNYDLRLRRFLSPPFILGMDPYAFRTLKDPRRRQPESPIKPGAECQYSNILGANILLNSLRFRTGSPQANFFRKIDEVLVDLLQ